MRGQRRPWPQAHVFSRYLGLRGSQRPIAVVKGHDMSSRFSPGNKILIQHASLDEAGVANAECIVWPKEH